MKFLLHLMHFHLKKVKQRETRAFLVKITALVRNLALRFTLDATVAPIFYFSILLLQILIFLVTL